MTKAQHVWSIDGREFALAIEDDVPSFAGLPRMQFYTRREGKSDWVLVPGVPGDVLLSLWSLAERLAESKEELERWKKAWRLFDGVEVPVGAKFAAPDKEAP